MFSSLFRNTIPRTILGRWERTPENLSSVKIRLSNIDHCGSCSIFPTQYPQSQFQPQTQPVTPITEHALQLTKECDGALMIVNLPDATKEGRRT